MKVVVKPIQMVAWFDEKGVPNPIRFKFENDDGTNIVIKIGKVIYKEKEKLAGNLMYVFKCQSVIDDVLKVYEIKYEIATCKWVLFKI